MIAGPTPAAAARALRATLQRALSCVTVGVLAAQADAIETRLSLTSRLARHRNDEPLTLSIRHAFGLFHDASRDADSRWQARTTGYIYSLGGADDREILAYHYHPAGRSLVTVPHLHTGGA